MRFGHVYTRRLFGRVIKAVFGPHLFRNKKDKGGIGQIEFKDE